jgi:hypothetical protein
MFDMKIQFAKKLFDNRNARKKSRLRTLIRKEGRENPSVEKGRSGWILVPSMTRESACSIPDDANDVDKQTDLGLQ